MVVVLMVFVIVLLDLWERHVNKKCVQMVALVMVVAMVLLEDVNVMLDMVVLIVLSQFAQTVKMESVEMMQLAYAKLVSKEQLAQKRHVTKNVLKMVENATEETVFAQQELLAFNVKQKLMFVQIVAAVMEFVMKQISNAIVTKDLVEMIVVSKVALEDVTNQMENALMENAFVLQTTVDLIALQKIVPTTVFHTENVTVKHIPATVNLVFQAMIAA